MGYPVLWVGAAMFALMGSATALYVRESTGRGQHVDTSLRDGALDNILYSMVRDLVFSPPRTQKLARAEFHNTVGLLTNTLNGGGANDSYGNGQRVTTLMAKIIRIDVNRTTGQYSVSASELLEIKTRAAALFAGKPA